ncbi:hypothetical protein Tco_1244714 [Tanacetum coccineum]
MILLLWPMSPNLTYALRTQIINDIRNGVGSSGGGDVLNLSPKAPYRMHCELRGVKEQLQEIKSRSLVILYLAAASFWIHQRVEAITKWPRPTTVTELMRKGEKFVWTDERNESFEELKQRLVSAPISDSSLSFWCFRIY